MTHTHAKGQSQRSLSSKGRVETDRRTNGRTEAIALPPVIMQSVTSRSSNSHSNRHHKNHILNRTQSLCFKLA